MDVLVLYATVEGQTRKIADFVAEQAGKQGHKVDLVDVDTLTELKFKGVDAVILAAPVHQRRHPRLFETTIEGCIDQLKERRTLMLSVSMNAAFPEGRDEAREYVTEMEMRTGFTPDATLLVAGAVRVSQYDYYAMQVIQHVVMRGRDYDSDTDAHEFTDWEALSAELVKFLS